MAFKSRDTGKGAITKGSPSHLTVHTYIPTGIFYRKK